MDFSRIASAIDVERLQQSRVDLIGAGASATLAGDLIRSGLGRLNLLDPDVVGPENLSRQGHLATHIGLSKVEALTRQLRSINPGAMVTGEESDFTQWSDDECEDYFSASDLLIFATDRFAVQAAGNKLALRLQKPAVWVGLYARGLGGEVVFWHPGIAACYRCLCANRYQAHQIATATRVPFDPPSDGATIFDVHFLDAIAGPIAVGLLTRGADNRFGRLIDALGNRNFLHVKIAPEFTWRGRDVIREQLGIPAECDTFFAWNTAARCDPSGGMPPCPDCVRFRPERSSPLSPTSLPQEI